MNRIKMFVGLLVCGLVLNGCAAVLVGGMFAKSISSKKQEAGFVESYNKNNIEREKIGLKPLDFCEEALRFNKRYYKSLKECKK